jgi:hypothetical protein
MIPFHRGLTSAYAVRGDMVKAKDAYKGFLAHA